MADNSSATQSQSQPPSSQPQPQQERHKFPEVQGGGSLILAWQVRGKNVLVIGGGEVAAGRILNLLNADAVVTCICPTSGLNPEVAYRVNQNQIRHVPRPFEPSDLDTFDPSMVLCAVDDPEASSAVWRLCQEKRIPANIADVPSECDFYFGSTFRDGPLQVMVSTNGNGPKLANIIRRRIGESLPSNAGKAIAKVGNLRRRLRKLAPEPERGANRMRWMSAVCEAWSLEDLCEMGEEDMNSLLEGFEKGEVKKLSDIRGPNAQATWEFDGSWGWSIGWG